MTLLERGDIDAILADPHVASNLQNFGSSLSVRTSIAATLSVNVVLYNWENRADVFFDCIGRNSSLITTSVIATQHENAGTVSYLKSNAYL